MDEYLSNGASGSMNRSSYFRVMALASMDILLTLPISVLVLVTGKVNTKLAVWPGWALLHNDWAPIRLPASFWIPKFWLNFSIRWDEWINPMFALVFFLIFGLTEEARGMYRSAFFVVLRVFGYERNVKPERSAIAFESFQVNPGPTE